jgi:glycosyltransferase involved in cell wall biosynthesis
VKISVALCTCNADEHLAFLLNSLLWQERPPDEIIVCDDQSTDRTLEQLRDFSGRAPFPVEIHVNPARLGSRRNFELAIGRCRGDVIALCDHDDLWKPSKLSRIEAAFRERPDRGLVISDAELLCESPGLLDEPPLRRLWQDVPFTPALQRRFNSGGGADLMLRWNVVTGPTAAFRADLRPLVLPIPETWLHDGWIGIVAAAVAPAHAIAEPLIVYRQHPNQETGLVANTLRAQVEAARVRLTRDYFERQAAAFEALADRFEANASRLLDKTLPARVRAKVRLARTQARMREVGRLPRLGLAIRELVTGRYCRYARGLRSFGVDALFP